MIRNQEEHQMNTAGLHLRVNYILQIELHIAVIFIKHLFFPEENTNIDFTSLNEEI